MKRRSFLKTLPALSAAPTMASALPVLEEPYECPKLVPPTKETLMGLIVVQSADGLRYSGNWKLHTEEVKLKDCPMCGHMHEQWVPSEITFQATLHEPEAMPGSKVILPFGRVSPGSQLLIEFQPDGAPAFVFSKTDFFPDEKKTLDDLNGNWPVWIP